MLINTHVHMSRFGVDFAPELGEYFANMFKGATCWFTGEPWQNNKGLRWLDPTNRDSWEYALDLAVESCQAGFDEIQFDYVRFPSDGPISKLEFNGLVVEDYYSQEKQDIRLETISSFLAEARSRLSPLGCATAADIFAITLESSTDEGLSSPWV